MTNITNIWSLYESSVLIYDQKLFSIEFNIYFRMETVNISKYRRFVVHNIICKSCIHAVQQAIVEYLWFLHYTGRYEMVLTEKPFFCLLFCLVAILSLQRWTLVFTYRFHFLCYCQLEIHLYSSLCGSIYRHGLRKSKAVRQSMQNLITSCQLALSFSLEESQMPF